MFQGWRRMLAPSVLRGSIPPRLHGYSTVTYNRVTVEPTMRVRCYWLHVALPKPKVEFETRYPLCDCSSVGRTPDRGSGRRGFKSHQSPQYNKMAPCVSIKDRGAICHSCCHVLPCANICIHLQTHATT